MRIRLVAHNRDEVKGGKVFWCRVRMTVRLEWINVQTTSDCLTRVASAIFRKSLYSKQQRGLLCAHSIQLPFICWPRRVI